MNGIIYRIAGKVGLCRLSSHGHHHRRSSTTNHTICHHPTLSPASIRCPPLVSEQHRVAQPSRKHAVRIRATRLSLHRSESVTWIAWPRKFAHCKRKFGALVSGDYVSMHQAAERASWPSCHDEACAHVFGAPRMRCRCLWRSMDRNHRHPACGRQCDRLHRIERWLFRPC